MTWGKRIIVFILLLVLGVLIITFGGKLAIPFAHVVGGIMIGFGISFILFLSLLEGNKNVK